MTNRYEEFDPRAQRPGMAMAGEMGHIGIDALRQQDNNRLQKMANGEAPKMRDGLTIQLEQLGKTVEQLSSVVDNLDECLNLVSVRQQAAVGQTTAGNAAPLETLSPAATQVRSLRFRVENIISQLGRTARDLNI